VDWIDAVFSAPPEMESRANSSEAQRKNQCEVSHRIVKANSSATQDDPLAYLSPARCLNLEYGEDRGPQNKNRKENVEF